ncbi:uncharacterized protein LOC132708539 [Cylas formicarius]|uniref:uncharacterized protein LOC132708539 n=1 Tax=Cylas formicarius TaxID=197179 RepID=UPI00295898D7|nr:uncharacterized protein LOC132708539 [Cylas formicarius]
MASQEEDNKLECISHVNKEQEIYFLNVYKKYDTILNDKAENFEKKVQALIDVWKSIAEAKLAQFDLRYVLQIIDWAKLHALNIVLTGEWRKTKETCGNSLLENIEKAQRNLHTKNDAFSSRCQKLADVVKKPWEDPVLTHLLHTKNAEIGPKEIEFFCVETAYLVSVRLKKLCENHCEDLALNLVTNFLNCKKLAADLNFTLNATETQIWFIFDIFVALLYKFQDKTKIIQQFEDLKLSEGIQLIKRFAKKRVTISKIWKNCHKIAIFGCRFFLSKALMKYSDDVRELLIDLMKTYIVLSNTDVLVEEFVVSVRNITNLADAAGLCIMCEVIHREGGEGIRHFTIEMYIRALTTDMNELERLKHVNDQEKAVLTTSRLASTFTNLADLLDDYVKVARECILTAFSLEPTQQRLKRIEDLAKRSGFQVLDTGQEWKCRLHPPVLPSDDIAWICPECGDWMCKPELTAPLQMNMALHEALQDSVLGISEALCDDLVVCLSNPRYQILSWLLAWGDLYRLCIMYLNDPEKTKNFITELKFVDIDYSMFEHIKREPIDEYTGIEKGYEQYLDLNFVSDEENSSVSEDSSSQDRSLCLGSDGAGEPYVHIPQTKSDPNTLKSLRMFRPNLKRKKEVVSEVPEKQKILAKPAGGYSSLSSYLSNPLFVNNNYPEVASACLNNSFVSTNFSPGIETKKSNKVNVTEATHNGINLSRYSTSYTPATCVPVINVANCVPTSAVRNYEARKTNLNALVSAEQTSSNISNVSDASVHSFNYPIESRSPLYTSTYEGSQATKPTTTLAVNSHMKQGISNCRSPYNENDYFNQEVKLMSNSNSLSKLPSICKSLDQSVPNPIISQNVNILKRVFASRSNRLDSNSHSIIAPTIIDITDDDDEIDYRSTASSSAFEGRAQSSEQEVDMFGNVIKDEDVDPKNVTAATLLQLGGQVAKNLNQIIQVPQSCNQHTEDSTTMKSTWQLKKSSHNGILENYSNSTGLIKRKQLERPTQEKNVETPLKTKEAISQMQGTCRVNLIPLPYLDQIDQGRRMQSTQPQKRENYMAPIKKPSPVFPNNQYQVTPGVSLYPQKTLAKEQWEAEKTQLEDLTWQINNILTLSQSVNKTQNQSNPTCCSVVTPSVCLSKLKQEASISQELSIQTSSALNQVESNRPNQLAKENSLCSELVTQTNRHLAKERIPHLKIVEQAALSVQEVELAVYQPQKEQLDQQLYQAPNRERILQEELTTIVMEMEKESYWKSMYPTERPVRCNTSKRKPITVMSSLNPEQKLEREKQECPDWDKLFNQKAVVLLKPLPITPSLKKKLKQLKNDYVSGKYKKLSKKRTIPQNKSQKELVVILEKLQMEIKLPPMKILHVNLNPINLCSMKLCLEANQVQPKQMPQINKQDAMVKASAQTESEPIVVAEYHQTFEKCSRLTLGSLMGCQQTQDQKKSTTEITLLETFPELKLYQLVEHTQMKFSQCSLMDQMLEVSNEAMSHKQSVLQHEPPPILMDCLPTSPIETTVMKIEHPQAVSCQSSVMNQEPSKQMQDPKIHQQEQERATADSKLECFPVSQLETIISHMGLNQQTEAPVLDCSLYNLEQQISCQSQQEKLTSVKNRNEEPQTRLDQHHTEVPQQEKQKSIMHVKETEQQETQASTATQNPIKCVGPSKLETISKIEQDQQNNLMEKTDRQSQQVATEEVFQSKKLVLEEQKLESTKNQSTMECSSALELDTISKIDLDLQNNQVETIKSKEISIVEKENTTEPLKEQTMLVTQKCLPVSPTEINIIKEKPRIKVIETENAEGERDESAQQEQESTAEANINIMKSLSSQLEILLQLDVDQLKKHRDTEIHFKELPKIENSNKQELIATECTTECLPTVQLETITRKNDSSQVDFKLVDRAEQILELTPEPKLQTTVVRTELEHQVESSSRELKFLEVAKDPLENPEPHQMKELEKQLNQKERIGGNSKDYLQPFKLFEAEMRTSCEKTDLKIASNALSQQIEPPNLLSMDSPLDLSISGNVPGIYTNLLTKSDTTEHTDFKLKDTVVIPWETSQSVEEEVKLMDRVEHSTEMEMLQTVDLENICEKSESRSNEIGDEIATSLSITDSNIDIQRADCCISAKLENAINKLDDIIEDLVTVAENSLSFTMDKKEESSGSQNDIDNVLPAAENMMDGCQLDTEEKSASTQNDLPVQEPDVINLDAYLTQIKKSSETTLKDIYKSVPIERECNIVTPSKYGEYRHVTLWHDYCQFPNHVDQEEFADSHDFGMAENINEDSGKCLTFSDLYGEMEINMFESTNKENIDWSDIATSAGLKKEDDLTQLLDSRIEIGNKYKKVYISKYSPKSFNSSKNIRKYFNTHKTSHSNVPCFKMDSLCKLKVKNANTKQETCGNNSLNCNVSDKKQFEVNRNSLPTSPNAIRLYKRKAMADIRKLQKILEWKQKEREKADIRGGFEFIMMKYKSDNDEKATKVLPLSDRNTKNCSKKNTKTFKKGLKLTKKKVKRKRIGTHESRISLKKPYKRRIGSPASQPRVVLEKLALSDRNFARSVLKNVPGLNDYSHITPTNVNPIVNVVQISGNRPPNATTQNTQTSTQVTPHIQRVGQPRSVEPKPESSNENLTLPPNSTPTSALGTTKPTTSQSSTLINILSQQIRPGQNAVRTRPAPFINILSQQIITPGQSPQIIKKSVPNSITATCDTNNQNSAVKAESTSEEIPHIQTPTTNTKPTTTTPKTTTTTTQLSTSTTPTNQGGTILQFICKSSLPKFQQAFGRTVYQSQNVGPETAEAPQIPIAEVSNTVAPVTSVAPATVEAKKVAATKAVPINVQPLQGNVIYRGQMPVGQTISLIPPGSTTRQLFRITGSTHEQISLVKETVIQNKMSALLAAALQGKPKVSEQNGEVVEEYSATRITLCRPSGVPNARIVKPVQLQIPANVIRNPQPNMSSTTLEQLREFDMVYKQVKERSSSSTQPESTNTNVESGDSPQQQRISFTYVNQVQKYTQLSPVVVVSSYSNLQPAVSPAICVTSQGSSSPSVSPASTSTLPKIASKTSKGKTLKSATTNPVPKAAPTIPKPQQKPQEDEHTTQRIFDILAEYAEQLRNSPDLNNKPAPRRRSNPPTNPTSNSKRKKSSGSKKQGNNSIETDNEDLTMGSEDSSGGNIVQLSVTDDEHSQATSVTPPESNSENSSSSRPLIVTDATNQPRNVIIADSSVGEALKMSNTALIVPGSYLMPVSMVKGSQQIVVSGGNKILTTVPARSGQNMLLFQSFLNQNKKGPISAVKYSTIQPISGIASQNIGSVTAQQPVVIPSNTVATAVALAQPITLKKIDDSDRINTELLLTISPSKENIARVDKQSEVAQPDSSTNLSNDSVEIKIDEIAQSHGDGDDKIFNSFPKTSSLATSVIASCIKEELNDNASETVIPAVRLETSEVKADETSKSVERMQSVLVNASTSNGPMLSHTNSRYRKASDPVESTITSSKELINREKTTINEPKIYKNNAVYYAIRTKKNVVNPASKKLESELQKQAAIERELRLQKSLSEECEDLGVDEPSTSDLFPEADLLFDSNHSPSYDQTVQDIKKSSHMTESKTEKTSMNLFSDDENSGPLRTDLFDYVEYHTVETAIDYPSSQLMNGNNTSNESASSSEDNTLLASCGTISEVTLNSPISPDVYGDNTQPALNKYKYKYTNRKKSERIRQTENWSRGEVTSTGDNGDEASYVGSEQITSEPIKVVRVAISKADSKEGQSCQLHCSTVEDNKRGARRSTKRACSCCNGSKSSGLSSVRKRPPTTRPQTPANKKAFTSKKR